MRYEDYLIANFSQGLDKRLQPWLIPDEAQHEMLDGYTYRGTMSKRDGYNYFATGERGGAPYCESRMVNRITGENVNIGGGTAGPYVITLLNPQIRRGTTTITAGAQSAVDNGLGSFTTTPPGGSGTINYTTGAISITFNAVVPGATPITATYDYHPGLPIMGVMNFTTSTNVLQLIVADTKRLNIYNSTTNRLDYLGRTIAITGITQANPGAVTAVAHGLITGQKVYIYAVQGMVEVNGAEFTITRVDADHFTIGVNTTGYAAYTTGGVVQLIFSGDNSNFFSWVNYPDASNNPRLLFTNYADEIGYYAPHLTPTVGNYANYSGFSMTSTEAVPAAVISIKALQIHEHKDRLVMTRTIETSATGTQNCPRRLRISGTGVSCDVYTTSATAPGAGLIDVGDQTWLTGADLNRDDLIQASQSSYWAVKYTGNDTTPFTLDRIDASRGSEAPFSIFTYLNRTSGADPRGLTISDGYRVERQDNLIPDFSYNDVDGAKFKLCFAGSVDTDRDHYLIYPTPKATQSVRILSTNYDEDNYCIYRLPLSCMGTFKESFSITWNDLLAFADWDALAAVYSDWNQFNYTAGAPFAVGGGHNGEVWRLSASQGEDNPVKIRGITVVDSTTLEVTTDWNNYTIDDPSNVNNDPNMDSSTIFFAGVLGMVEINNRQFPITTITNNHVFRIKVPTGTYSAYTSGGQASRVIPFEVTMKKFNPYVSQGQKVRCGYLYMYVDESGTSLERQVAVSAITNAVLGRVTTQVAHGLKSGQQIGFIGIGGMTQLNNNFYTATVVSDTVFTINVDTSAFGVYTSGGFITVKEPAKIEIEVITDDNESSVQVDSPYPQQPFQGRVTNLSFETGSKKWYKVYINQVGKFIQFRLKNTQAGAKINIQALMPGFGIGGRMI